MGILGWSYFLDIMISSTIFYLKMLKNGFFKLEAFAHIKILKTTLKSQHLLPTKVIAYFDEKPLCEPNLDLKKWQKWIFG